MRRRNPGAQSTCGYMYPRRTHSLHLGPKSHLPLFCHVRPAMYLPLNYSSEMPVRPGTGGDARESENLDAGRLIRIDPQPSDYESQSSIPPVVS